MSPRSAQKWRIIWLFLISFPVVFSDWLNRWFELTMTAGVASLQLRLKGVSNITRSGALADCRTSESRSSSLFGAYVPGVC